MWHDKRRELALKLREQKAEHEASRITFQHERAEKLRKTHNAQHKAAQPASHVDMPMPAPRASVPADTRTFVGMCNQRETAPVAASGGWNEDTQRTTLLRGAGQVSILPPGYRRDNTSGYGTALVGNAKWFVPDNRNMHTQLDSSSAPRGFPLRKGGGMGKTLTEMPFMGNKRWAEQAMKASLQENGREQLDRLLMQRVSQFSSTAALQPSRSRLLSKQGSA